VTDAPPVSGDPILRRTLNDAVRVEVLYESETFWLDQKRIAELFGAELPTISYHLKEVCASGELVREATLREVLRVQREGEPDARARLVSRLGSSLPDTGRRRSVHGKAPVRPR